MQSKALQRKFFETGGQMANPLLQHYIKLTEFLGQALGPDYEVALHDMTDKNRSIVAIANNHISGREIGAPLTNVALKILMDKSYETQDYRLHYCGLSAEGKTLRSSTMFIKHNSKLVGMLCINFDDSRYLAASENVLRLCHPDIFIDDHIAPQQAEPGDPFPRAFRQRPRASTTRSTRWQAMRSAASSSASA